MVRWLVLLLCLILSARAFSADEIYLSDAEKAMITLLLKSNAEREPTQRLQQVVSKLKVFTDASETTTVTVKSYAEFIELQKNSALYEDYRLDEISDRTLLAHLKPVRYVSPSLKVQRKIEVYETAKIETFKKLFGYVGGSMFQAMNLEKKTVQDLQTEIESAFTKQVAQLTSELSQKNSAQVVVLSKLLEAYFKALPSSQKTEILYRLAQMPLNSRAMDIFLVMIQNAGPQLQKLVQIMGRSEHIPDEFKEIFQKLESQVKPIPWWKVKKILGDNNVDLTQFTYFEREPVGVGTMAQTHRVQYIDDSGVRRSAVMRFLKPDIEKYLEMDHQILIKISQELDADPEIKKLKVPSLSDLVEDLHQSVVEELDMAVTVKNQNKAQKDYFRSDVIAFNGQKNRLEISVPKASLYESKPGLMLQDLVIGAKPAKEFSKFGYDELYPDLYKIASEKMAEMWVEEAFFKSGFFHADLHQGNILAYHTDEAVRINILDFGMVGHLDKQLQQSALLLALGIKLDRADMIANHFLKLSKMNNESLTAPKLQKLVQKRIDLMQKDPTVGGSLEVWTAWALDQGIELQYEFLKLNRGLTAISGLLTDSKSPNSIEKLALRVVFKNKKFVSNLLLRQSGLSPKDYVTLAAQVFGSPVEAGPAAGAAQCRALFE